MNLTDALALEVVGIRLGADDLDQFYAEKLLLADEALACMDQNDLKQFKDQQGAAEDAREARAAFVQDYQQARRRIDDSKMEGKAKKDKKPKQMAVTTAVFGPGGIPQPTAKKYVLAGASIWKDKTHGGWCAHCPPRARISEPYDGDEAGALLVILKRLWGQHLELRALDWFSCPWVFP